METAPPLQSTSPSSDSTFNARLVAVSSTVTALVVLVLGILPRKDSNGVSCGSAFAPESYSGLRNLSEECVVRMAGQQGYLVPLLVVSIAVAFVAWSWRSN